MRLLALSLATGLCLVAGTPSAAATGPLTFTCKPQNGGQTFSVTVDVAGHRAKAHVLQYRDDQVAYTPATVTADSVSWRVREPKEGLTNVYTLDRTTGTFRQLMTEGYGQDQLFTYTCKAATRLF